MGTTAVDLAALEAAAVRLDAAAESVTAAAARLGALQFDAAAAGRAHGRAGAALRTEVERLAMDLTRWGHAAREDAVVLRAGAGGHTAAETAAAAALR